MAINSYNFINDVITNSKHKIILSTSGGAGGATAITGYLSEDVSLGGSANWGEIFNSSGVQDKVQKVIQSVGSSDLTNMSMTMPIQQRKAWTDTQIQGLNFNFRVLAIKESDDVTILPKSLFKGVFPQEGGGGATRKFNAPMGYRANVDSPGIKPSGTWVVKIPNLLVITDLVMTSSSVSFSKERLPNGKPLYADVSVSFDTAEPVSYSEVLGWFV